MQLKKAKILLLRDNKTYDALIDPMEKPIWVHPKTILGSIKILGSIITPRSDGYHYYYPDPSLFNILWIEELKGIDKEIDDIETMGYRYETF